MADHETLVGKYFRLNEHFAKFPDSVDWEAKNQHYHAGAYDSDNALDFDKCFRVMAAGQMGDQHDQYIGKAYQDEHNDPKYINASQSILGSFASLSRVIAKGQFEHEGYS